MNIITIIKMKLNTGQKGLLLQYFTAMLYLYCARWFHDIDYILLIMSCLP